MICPHCSKSVHPVKELADRGKFIDTCPECAGVIGAVMRADVVVEVERQLDLVATREIRGRVTMPMPASVLDHVAALRARLVAVEAQIPTVDQLKALRRERTQLRAALRALDVELEPKPN